MPRTSSPPKPHIGRVDRAPERPDIADLVEQAEAEAAEAEALAAAARARVRAIRSGRTAEATQTASPQTSEVSATDAASIASDAEPELPSAAAAVDAEMADAAELPADETGEPPLGTARRFRRPSRTTVAVGIGILCTAALLATSALLVRHHQDVLRRQQRAAEFSAAARQVVVTLMSISPASAKDDVQHIIDSSTGQFRDEFKGAAEDFAKVAQSAKVSTKTTVQATAVESMTDDTAVVLVAASSTLTNSTGASEQPRSWRLSLKLAREGGRVKMSSMEFIP
jgi:Mce-associated membrane protein